HGSEMLRVTDSRYSYESVTADCVFLGFTRHTSSKSGRIKSREELEATQNVEKLKVHLMAEEIKKLVKGSKNVKENVKADSSPLRNNDNQTNPDTRLEPMSDKESPEVENITKISQPVNVIEEEEESAEDYYELKSKEKGKHVEEIRKTPYPTTIRSLGFSLILYPQIPRDSRCYGYLFEHLSAKFMPRRKSNVLAKNLEEIIMESLPKLVDDRVKGILKTQVPLHVAQGLILEREKSQADVAKMIADAIQLERENLQTEISSQVNEAIDNHIPLQTNSYAIDDDVLPNEKVSQELVDEMLMSYNNDIKYGYVTSKLSKDDVEYLQLFAEEIEYHLKHRDQMRRWEMYVNGRPLGSRRKHNRPPMLEKPMYRMELYMENIENERMILDSVQNGPLVWPTIVQGDSISRKKKYEELSVTENIQAVCDLKAANIVL
nr:hypothetical protein [Tanacetum cinerariifolium]